MSRYAAPSDEVLLYLDDPAAPLHTTTVLVVEGPVDSDGLAAAIAERLAPLEALSMRATGHEGRLRWATHHPHDAAAQIGQVTLPPPGTKRALEDFVAQWAPVPLDRDAPLWRIHVVNGLDDGRRAAVVVTAHPVLAADADLDLVGVLAGTGRAPSARGREQRWSMLDQVLHEAAHAVADPRKTAHRGLAAAAKAPAAVVKAPGAAVRATRRAAGRLGDVMQSAPTAPAPDVPLRTTTSSRRAVRVVELPVADLDRAKALVEGATTRDVVLCVLAGALRTWLLGRAEPVQTSSSVRALAPVSVVSADGQDHGDLQACLVDLPVGEPQARMRLRQVAHATRRQLGHGRAVRARDLMRLAGFAPSRLQARGTRLAREVSARMVNLVVLDVPGPQAPIDVMGHRVVSTFPVIPVLRGHALSVGATSYEGTVAVTFDADAAAVPDLDVLSDAVSWALADLAGAKEE